MVRLSQDGAPRKALGSIWEIPAKTVTELMGDGGVEGIPEDAEGGNYPLEQAISRMRNLE